MDKGIQPGGRGNQPGAVQGNSSKSTEAPKRKGSFSTKEVVNYPATSYMPGSSSSGSESKPLSEWEIAIADIERVFFNAVASIEEQKGSGSEARATLAKQLTDISDSASRIVSDYNKRVVELGDKDEISATNVRQLQQKIAFDLRGCADHLSELRGVASSNSKAASRQSIPKLIEETRAAIGRFNTHLASLKSALDAANTRLPPELAVAKLDSELRGLQQQLAKLPNGRLDEFSSEVRLHLGRAKDYVSKPEAIQNGWSNAQKEKAEFQRSVMSQTYESVWDLRKKKFKALDLSAKKKKVNLSSSEAKVVKQTLQAHLANAIEALKDFTTWKASPTPQSSPKVQRNESVVNAPVNDQPTTSTPVAPAKPTALPLPRHFDVSSQQLKTPALQALMEDVEGSATTADQTAKMKTLQDYLTTKYEEQYRHVEPLLTFATQKSRLMRGTDTELVTSMQHALKGLRDYQQAVSTDPFDENTTAALKAADAGLAKLEAMGKQIPPQLAHLLTEATPTNPQPADHLLNLMNRQLLQGDGRYLTSPKDVATYQLMTDYLNTALSQGERAAAPHLNQMLDKTFESYETVAALAGEPRSLGEANALIPLYKDWSVKGAAALQEVEELARVTSRDLPGNAVTDGVAAYKKLTTEQLHENINKASDIAATQHRQLHTVLQQHISEMAHQRLHSQKWTKKTFSPSKVCEEVSKELNTQLGRLAHVTIEPGKKLSEAKITVDVGLPPSVEKTQEAFEQNVNLNTAALQELREKLTAREHAELIQVKDARCRWLPHPPKLLRSFMARFGKAFHDSQEAIRMAGYKKPELQRFADARAAVNRIAAQDSWNIPAAKGFGARRSATKRAMRELQDLEVRMKSISNQPLQDIQRTASEEKDRVVEMLKARQISHEQAAAALKPLFALHQAAKSRDKDAAYQLKEEGSMAPPQTYTYQLDKLHKALNPRLFHQVFRTKKWKALEHTKALVAVCQRCEHTPMQALHMVTGYSSSLANSPDRYQQDLGKALDAYSEHLNHYVQHSDQLVEAY